MAISHCTDFPLLPAQILDGQGKRHVNYRAIAKLSIPLFLDSLTYIINSLTDTWFLGRLSTDATAALGAINWLMFVSIMLLASVGVAVQTLVAQAFGSGDLTKAAKTAWTGIWIAVLTIPVYVLLATHGQQILSPFRLEPQIEQLALAYWLPRMLGGSLVVADWTFRGFFNATNRTHLTFTVTGIVCILKPMLNQLFIFQFGWGMAGAAWATTIALIIGLTIQFWLFFQPAIRQTYQIHQVWQPNLRGILNVLGMGLFTGLFMTSDLVGLALFQMMQVTLGVAPGAATQIVITLLSLAYQPAVGFGEAGIILVGQSIGAGDRQWAKRLGNAVIRLAVVYMVIVGIGLAISGTVVVSRFVTSTDIHAAEVMTIAPKLLWIAASYQLFNALIISATFCLQGAGDIKFPAIVAVTITLLGFVPLAHILSFRADQGFVDFLPHLGFGVFGGWVAYAVHMMILGIMLWQRWRSGAWQKRL